MKEREALSRLKAVGTARIARSMRGTESELAGPTARDRVVTEAPPD
jgi:hypothetical protein